MNQRSLRPEYIWLLLGAAVLGLLLVAGLSAVVAKHHWAVNLVEQIEPRYARLAGLRADGDRLKAMETALGADLNSLAYGSGADAAQAGNEALQRLRSAVASHGLQVASSQVLPAREEGGFLRIGLNLRVDGDLVKLRDFLRDMSALQKPVIFSESIQLASQPVRAQQQTVSAQLNLFVLKVQP